jgi:hypothetical protein
MAGKFFGPPRNATSYWLQTDCLLPCLVDVCCNQACESSEADAREIVTNVSSGCIVDD